MAATLPKKSDEDLRHPRTEGVGNSAELQVAVENICQWVIELDRGDYTSERNREAEGSWSEINKLKANIVDSQPNVRIVFHLAYHTIVRWERYLLKRSKKTGPSECSINDVCIAALTCVSAILTGINQTLEASATEIDLSEAIEAWDLLMHELMKVVDTRDSNIPASAVDVLADIGFRFYDRLPEKTQKLIMVYVLGFIADKRPQINATVRAKFGRCVGKLIEFPCLRDDLDFFLHVFDAIIWNITEGEFAVKTAYAWAFGNWTDALLRTYSETDLEPHSKNFGSTVIMIAGVSIKQVPAKGRYNVVRACGNIFTWTKPEIVEKDDIKNVFVSILTDITALVGNGMDYKLRWNAAHSVGRLLENTPVVDLLGSTVINPVITTLAKWLAHSQNYKERTQCVVSLMKIKTRAGYGTLYVTLWEKVFASVSRLPVDDSESKEKFKHESLIMVFHLINLLTAEDVPRVSKVIEEFHESFKSLVVDTISEIPLERLDGALLARDNLTEIRKSVRVSEQDEMIGKLLETLNEACPDN